ncbi:MAG: mechanosensitive ion channel family protein [Bacteroidetes bacterium]|nr:mechanosensitive ion channel family protein [Bacteroidota bacterium]
MKSPAAVEISGAFVVEGSPSSIQPLTGLMDQFIEGSFLGNEVLWGVDVWRLGVALVLVFLGLLSRRIVRMFFQGFLKRRVARTRIQWDDDLIELAPRPVALVVQVLLWFAVALVLDLPDEPANIRRFIVQGLIVALAVAFSWVAFALIDVLSRVAARAATRTETPLDDQLVPLLRKTLKVFLAVVVAIIVVDKLGYSIASLVASLGIGGLALALAARDTVANFFGSIVIFTDQPFHIGDWVEFGGVEGVVEEVGMRTTHIRRFDKSLATVPNQTFTNSTIVNHSKRPLRRLKTSVGLSYETTPDQMRTFLESVRALLAGHPALDPDGQRVYFNEFADSSLNILIQCWTKSTAVTDFLKAQEDIFLSIMQLVEEQGLEIAFPTRTLYFRDEQWNATPPEGDR